MPKMFPARMYPPFADRAQWAAVPENVKREAADLADTYREIPWPLRTAGGIRAFKTTGSRKADEDNYFLRRRKLTALVLNMLITGGKQDFDEIINGLFLIMEETTWSISAHLDTGSDPFPDIDRPMLDLFAAQTGMIMALCHSLLADEVRAVSPNLEKRMRLEVERRVIGPFLNRDDFWWMGNNERVLNNWTPWILGNVLTAAGVLCGEAGFMQVYEKAVRIRDRFLRDMPEDGACDEGAAYWNVSGGSLLEVLLWQEYAGEKNVFASDKVRNILTYPSRAYLGSGCFVNFADCDFRPWIAPETLVRCGRRTGDQGMLNLGVEMRGRIGLKAYLSDTVMFRRMLDACFPEDAGEKKEEKPQDVYYPSIQLRILKKAGWTLAIKGGHNGESHNHNDVASFILFSGDDAVIADSGNMTYTAKTFSDARYTLFNTRSRNHSVPMPFGLEQKDGRAFGASRAECLESGLEIEYSGAYGDSRITEMVRRAELDGQTLCLHDRITVTEQGDVDFVFLSRRKPEKTENGYRLGPVLLEDSGRAWEIEEIRVEDARMAKSYPGSFYRMTVKLAMAEGRNEYAFCFRYIGEE